MSEMPFSIYSVELISKNIHNFRHGEEHPTIVGVSLVKPTEESEERLCYDVLYSSDSTIDMIPVSSVENGDWEYRKYEYRTDTE